MNHRDRNFEKMTLLGTILMVFIAFNVACLPQGGKEERVKKKAAAHTSEGDKSTQQKTADATGQKDCEKKDDHDHDHELRLHEDDEEDHADECVKSDQDAKKTDGNKEKPEEEHAEGEEDHDHD